MTSATSRGYIGSAFKYWRQSLRWKRQWPTKPAQNQFTRWRKSIASGRSALVDNEPWITFTARDFLLANLHKSSRVFEWGSGGSTLFFLQHAAEVYTVEHEERWFKDVLASVRSEGYEHWNGELIPPVLVDGKRENLDPADWKNYLSGCKTLINYSMQDYASCIDQYEDNYFDIIMVDGRARPSCLFHAWKKLKPDGLLFLDNAEVNYYNPMCNLLTKNCGEYFEFAGAGPYIPSFWVTCAWQKPKAPCQLLLDR